MDAEEEITTNEERRLLENSLSKIINAIHENRSSSTNDNLYQQQQQQQGNTVGNSGTPITVENMKSDVIGLSASENLKHFFEGVVYGIKDEIESVSSSSSSLLGENDNERRPNDAREIERFRESVKLEDERTNRIVDAINGLKESFVGAGRTASKSSSSSSSGLIGGAFEGLGNMPGLAIKGVASGFAFAGSKAPLIIAGAGAIAAAIAVIGGGIGLAAWMSGKGLSSFAENLKSFEELDGKALSSAGNGLKDLGVGLLAWTAGDGAKSVIDFITGPLDGITNALSSGGGKDKFERMFEDLQVFGKDYGIDDVQVEKNSRALVAFGKAMSIQGIGDISSSLGNTAKFVSEGLIGFFGGEQSVFPYKDILEFQKYEFDFIRIENNANAVIAFSKALGIMGATDVATSTTGLISSIFGGISTMLDSATGRDGFMDKIEAFQKRSFSVSKISNNIAAMLIFTSGQLVQDSLTTVGSAIGILDGIFTGLKEKLFPSDNTKLYDDIIKFQTLDFNFEKISSNVASVAAFSSAQIASGTGTAIAGLGDIIGGIGDLFNRIDGKDDPFADIIAFQNLNLNKEMIQKNTDAMNIFSGMKSVKGGADAIGGWGEMVAGIGTLFSSAKNKEDPFYEINKFGEKAIDTSNLENNIRAFELFSEMKIAKADGDLGSFWGNVSSGISSWFNGDETSSLFDYIERFASKIDLGSLDAFQEKMNALKEFFSNITEFSKNFGKKSKKSDFSWIYDLTKRRGGINAIDSLIESLQKSTINKDDSDQQKQSIKKTIEDTSFIISGLENILNGFIRIDSLEEKIQSLSSSKKDRKERRKEIKVLIENVYSTIDMFTTTMRKQEHSSSFILGNEEQQQEQREVNTTVAVAATPPLTPNNIEQNINRNDTASSSSSGFISFIDPKNNSRRQKQKQHPSLSDQQKKDTDSKNDLYPLIESMTSLSSTNGFSSFLLDNNKESFGATTTAATKDSISPLPSIVPLAERKNFEQHKGIVEGVVQKVSVESINTTTMEKLLSILVEQQQQQQGGSSSSSVLNSSSSSSSTIINVSSPSVTNNISAGTNGYSSSLRGSIGMNN